MLAFAVCLTLAGATLSIFARVPALLAVLGLTLLAIVAASGLPLVGLDTSHPLPVNLIVAVVALQVGYGLGVILRASLMRFFKEPSADVTQQSAQDETRNQ
ncbi:hypothetical protein [Methylobacterium nodulans]|uniref:Uncharacterized protein n=1 Tax=Methylobacterium nodulans (strain LMG 21967 / CNCM I-2342 / ORS 2060) TaxID=460265 RepID=B8IGI0_METNO|nr:hypothetical protein [Methylobacterium nodulans]ACL55880.1 hypothetical protein Mnod_0856 [Methylobacterium nodulans ORS 2060]